MGARFSLFSANLPEEIRLRIVEFMLMLSHPCGVVNLSRRFVPQMMRTSHVLRNLGAYQLLRCFTIQASGEKQLLAFERWVDWWSSSKARCGPKHIGCHHCRSKKHIRSLAVRHPRVVWNIPPNPLNYLMRSMRWLTHLTVEPFIHDMVSTSHTINQGDLKTAEELWEAFDMGRWSTFESLRTIFLCGTVHACRHWHEKEQDYAALRGIKERLHREFAMENRAIVVRLFMIGTSPHATFTEVQWSESSRRLVRMHVPKPQPWVFDPYLPSDKYVGYQNTGLISRQQVEMRAARTVVHIQPIF